MKRLKLTMMMAMGVAASAGWIPTASWAADVAVDPSETVRRAVGEAMAVIYEKPAEKETIAARTLPVMEKYFDFAMMTRRAAGPHWTHYSPEQQKDTTRLLTLLAVRSYCAHFDPVVRTEVTYLAPVALSSERREFRTLMTYYGQNYTVNYRAEQIAGEWHFYDVVVEGVSLVANYRAQFDSLFQRGGPEAVIRALEETLANPLPTK